MAWLAIETDDILNSLTQQEQSQMSDPASASDMAQIVSSVVSLVLGKMYVYGPYQTYSGPPGTIPEETYAAAIAIARYKFLTHLPGTQLITKWREAENTQAYKLLDDMASGNLWITMPVPAGNLADSGGEPYFPPYPCWLPPQRSWGYW